jgi:hypothetical protein
LRPHCRICLGKEKINFSTAFAGQAVGIKEVHDDIWLVMDLNHRPPGPEESVFKILVPHLVSLAACA